jgi:hypothetical protein
MPMLRLPIAVVQAICPWTSLGCPSMLTFAVPAPADAVTDPEVADTADVSAFLLEQPTKPATTIAVHPTPTVNPRSMVTPFARMAHSGPSTTN